MIDIDYCYASIFGNVFFGIIWLILFLIRKDLRKEILIMSFFSTPLGPLSEKLYLRDYWHPEFFSNTAIKIEDVLFAFFIGGRRGNLRRNLW